MKQKNLQFIQWDEFYKYYQPLTPYGNDDKQQCRIYTDLAELSRIFDQTEAFRAYINDQNDRFVKCEYHLKRIPELNSLDRPVFDQTDLFLLKKFLLNYQNIVELLPDNLKEMTACRFVLQDLLAQLCIDGKQDEIFYLSEKYSEELAKIRAEIRTMDAELRANHTKRLGQIKSALNLDFRFQDFIVIPESLAVHLDRSLVFMESYDNSQVVVKPIFSEQYYTLHLAKEKLVETEKQLEKSVLENLTIKVKNYQAEIENCIIAVEKIDLSLARAKLSLKINSVRPVLADHCSGIQVKNGRLLPLADKCAVDQLTYQPLNLELDHRLMVLNGSNMGGKTILLKTVLFLQTVTQCGLFVPAEYFCSTVFANLVFVGENNSGVAGLSSFGLEIFNFMEGYQFNQNKILFIIDEFARTTNSREASALLTAVVQAFDENPTVYALFSTHFMELPQFKNLAFYRMQGLNKEAYTKYYHKSTNMSLVERIRLINNFMQYHAEPDDRQNPPYDALLIAEILGLDSKIVELARKKIK